MSLNQNKKNSTTPQQIVQGVLFVFLTLFTTLTQASETNSARQLTLGVFPFVKTAKIEGLFTPAASRLGEILGIPMTVRSSPGMQKFRERIKQQRYDLIFIQPFDYTRFAAKSGYIPLARWTLRNTSDHPGEFNAIFVVREDNPIRSLSDLSDKKIVAPSQGSAVTILGELILRDQFPQKTIPLEYRPNHFSCLQQVASRHADVCISAAPPLEMFSKKHRIPLRVIYMSQWIPSSGYAVHERIPESQRQKLREEMLSWKVGQEADRQYLLKGVWSHLHPANDSDYDPVRTLWRTYQSAQ